MSKYSTYLFFLDYCLGHINALDPPMGLKDRKLHSRVRVTKAEVPFPFEPGNFRKLYLISFWSLGLNIYKRSFIYLKAYIYCINVW